MTKNEARAILTQHNKWRRGEITLMQPIKGIGIAIDAICEPPSIVQSIRNAAINWPQYLGDVECAIMAAFAYESESIDCIYGLHTQGLPWAEEYSNQSLTFMLLVAEALE